MKGEPGNERDADGRPGDADEDDAGHEDGERSCVGPRRLMSHQVSPAVSEGQGRYQIHKAMGEGKVLLGKSLVHVYWC